jgi:DNA-binding beta-propeller fold protein YncE
METGEMRDLRHLSIRGGFAVLILLLAGLASACHSNSISVMVTVSPSTMFVSLQGTTQFTTTVTNATDTTVTWQVNGVTGGNSTCGTISTNGVYTAPSVLPGSTACAGSTSTSTACTTSTNGHITANSGCVLITAVSNQDSRAMGTASVTLSSGVTITVAPTGTATVGTGENLSFIATVSGSTNLNVNWLVNSTQGGSATTGTITSTTIGNGTLANAAIFTAPATVPSPATVTVEAQAVADTSQTQTISVTIVTAADPTVTSVNPFSVPAGGVLEDVYLSGTNFLSTTSVLWSSIDISTLPSGSVTAVSSTLLRARIPSNLLSNPGPVTVEVQRQNGNRIPAPTNGNMCGAQPAPVCVVSVRPTLLGASPVAPLVQNSASTSVELSGGYFTPSTVSEWNGHLVSSMQDANFPRTLQATLSSSDLTEAGLFSIAVRTPAASPPRSAINVPVRPTATPVVAPAIGGFSRSNGTSGGPVALAFNDITGAGVVVDQGTNSLVLLNSAFTSIAAQVGVGTTPTSVAVDGLRNLALVTDSASNDLAVVDLSVPALQATLNCVGSAPVAVGVDEIHGRALVVNQNGSAATVLDTTHPMSCPMTQAISSISRSGGTVTATLAAALTIPGGNGTGVVTIAGVADASFDGTFVVLTGSGTTTLTWAQAAADASSTGGSASTGSVLGTVFAVTGAKPQVAVLPQLGWAIVTPGGTGTLTVVDLVRLTVVFTSNITSTTRGVAVNSEAKSLLLADPSSGSSFIFSLLDQSVSSLVLNVGNVAAATNPFTNVGIVLNPGLHQAFVVDMSTPAQLGSPVALGSDPIAVTLDAATNMALVADDVDGTVTAIDLGATRSRLGEPQILQVSPTITVTSGSAVPLLVTGAGFVCPGSQIRLDETVIPINSCSSRELTASIPVGFLAQPRRLVVDVLNPGSLFSNVVNVLIALPVPVGNSPQGVAIDQDHDQALVANSGGGTVSIIDLSPARPATFGSVTSTVTVGSTPIGLGVVSHAGLAVVTNSGSSSASVINLATNPVTVTSTVTVGADPTGVGVSESFGSAFVTNTGSNSVNLFSLSAAAGTLPSALGVDSGPVAAAIAPDLNLAVTAQATANDAIIFNIASGTPVLANRMPNISQASGADYDPVNQIFLIQSSGSNAIVAVNPITLLESSIRTGVDPTSLAYNFQSGTMLTLNSGSGSLSLLDLPNSKVRDVLPIASSSQYAVAIHRRLELVVIADAANNRVLLFPTPR